VPRSDDHFFPPPGPPWGPATGVLDLRRAPVAHKRRCLPAHCVSRIPGHAGIFFLFPSGAGSSTGLGRIVYFGARLFRGFLMVRETFFPLWCADPLPSGPAVRRRLLTD